MVRSSIYWRSLQCEYKPMLLFFLVDFLQNPYIILIEEIIELHVKI